MAKFPANWEVQVPTTHAPPQVPKATFAVYAANLQTQGEDRVSFQFGPRDAFSWTSFRGVAR
eukprot:3040430-Rhodomonas_salina.1